MTGQPFRLPRIRGTQIGLRDPEMIERLKEDMRAGLFPYDKPECRIGGVVDRRNVYHVVEGHHRVAAALEIFKESGDATPIQELLRYGCWSRRDKPPHESRPLPARTWWGALRNRLGW